MSDDERKDEGLTPEPEPEATAEPEPDVTPAPPEEPAPAPTPAAIPPPPPPPPPVRPTYAAPGYPAAVPPHWMPQPQVVVQQRRSSPLMTVLIVLMLVFFGFLLVGLGSYFISGGDRSEGPSLGGPEIAVIEIEGVIRDGGEGGFFSGPAGARGIMKDIRAARKDDGVDAVILLINSPGGSPAASHAIYEEILRLREKKRVVACMTDVAASGGYYVASACDKIVAQGSTLTGSIGVIFGNIGFYGLMKKLGITDETMTAGKYKDMGSGMSPMSAEEKALMQAMLSDIYTQFITAIAEGRKMDPAKVRRLAEGRIYTGAQAKKVGLVDELGNFYDAARFTVKLAGLKGEPQIKYMNEPKGLFSELMASETSFRRLLSGQRGYWNELPLQGPMLLMPYTYGVQPSLPLPSM